MKHTKMAVENINEKDEFILAHWVKALNIEFCEV